MAALGAHAGAAWEPHLQTTCSFQLGYIYTAMLHVAAEPGGATGVVAHPPGCYLGICSDASAEGAGRALFLKPPPQEPCLPGERNLGLESVP